jgi:hypothetical protein
MIERSKTSPNLQALANEAGEVNNSENENAPPRPAVNGPEVENNENENQNNNGGIQFRQRTRKLLRLRKQH